MSSALPKRTTQRIEAVVKITERCNINCTYCYMFNKGNDDYKGHPPYMSLETMRAISHYLRDGAVELGAKEVTIIIHGGEPLMAGRDFIDAMCSQLKSDIGTVASVRLAMQSNAMLIDQKWISLFARHEIGVGISIDGPKPINDAARVDHHGRGTYDGTLRGLRLMQRAAAVDLVAPPGVLCVIDGRRSGKEIYRHFVDDLRVTSMNFLLPMESHDTFGTELLPGYERYLCEIFDEWIADDNPAIRVRILEQALAYFSGSSGDPMRYRKRKPDETCLVTIASNGDVGPDDELKPIRFGQGTTNVANSTLASFWSSELMTFISAAYKSLPGKCRECCWQNYCCGGAQHGSMINRYSAVKAFDNPSILCEPLQGFYARVASYLIGQGLSKERVAAVLDYSGEKNRPAPTLRAMRRYVPLQVQAD